jgi:hypothetical protein
LAAGGGPSSRYGIARQSVLGKPVNSAGVVGKWEVQAQQTVGHESPVSESTVFQRVRYPSYSEPPRQYVERLQGQVDDLLAPGVAERVLDEERGQQPGGEQLGVFAFVMRDVSRLHGGGSSGEEPHCGTTVSAARRTLAPG